MAQHEATWGSASTYSQQHCSLAYKENAMPAMQPGKRVQPCAGQGSCKKNRYAIRDISSGCQEDVFMHSDANTSAMDVQVSSGYTRQPLQPLASDRINSHKHSSSSHVDHHKVHQERIIDIDFANRDNPLACSAYAQAIFEHLREAEVRRLPNPQYVAQVQCEMTSHMRAVLVDWLVEVAQEYKLASDTLFLGIHILDRFLSLRPVGRDQLQLAGVASMWIAAKYEEIYAPTSRDFCFITDNTYTRSQLGEMEAKVLEVLGYELTAPTTKTFLRRFLMAAEADAEQHFLSSYLSEVALLDEHMLAFLPSQTAAAAVLLARMLLRLPQPWTPTLAYHATYSRKDLQPCVEALAALHVQMMAPGCQYPAVGEKYSDNRLLCVARTAPLTASQLKSFFAV